MKTYLVAFVIAFVIAVPATYLVRMFALRLNLKDSPDPLMKIHTKPMPRIGGVAILLAVLVPLSSFYFYPESVAIQSVQEAPGHLSGLFLGATLICLLGLIDDLKGMNAWIKLLGQISVSVLMYFLGFKITILGNPFGPAIHLGLLSLPATVFWFVAVMNAINLTDGLDGLAAGLSLIISLVLFIWAIVTANGVLGVTSIILAGALLGFLVFNFNPARIFMGDSGSNLVGFLLASFSIMAHVKGQAAMALFLPMVALGVPFLDVGLSILRRIAMKQPVFSGDKKHIHHLLLQRGFSEKKTALLMYGMGAVFAAMALMLVFTNNKWTTALLFLVLLLIVALIMRFLGYHRMVWFSVGDRHILDNPVSVRLRDALREIFSFSEVERSWDSFSSTLIRHGMSQVILLTKDGTRHDVIYSSSASGFSPSDSDSISCRFRINPIGHDGLEAMFTWKAMDGQFAPLPHEITFLRVAADLAERLPIPPKASTMKRET